MIQNVVRHLGKLEAGTVLEIGSGSGQVSLLLVSLLLVSLLLVSLLLVTVLEIGSGSGQVVLILYVNIAHIVL